jgi:hypothetical protein
MKKDFKKELIPGGVNCHLASRASINAAFNIEIACNKQSIYKKLK